MCPVRAIFLEFTKNALKMRPLRALFFEFTKNSHEMCPLRALSLKFTKSAHKFALFQHHIPCPQKMLDARLDLNLAPGTSSSDKTIDPRSSIFRV